MPKRSAGILLYRLSDRAVQVLLVHPGGPLWRNKRKGAWQIPKGHIEPGEDDEAAARREVAEELGIAITEPLSPLGDIRQTGGKIVVAFAVNRDIDTAAVVSNRIDIIWPPRSGRTISIPEIDEAQWFSLDAARDQMLASQTPLLERLARLLSGDTPSC